MEPIHFNLSTTEETCHCDIAGSEEEIVTLIYTVMDGDKHIAALLMTAVDIYKIEKQIDKLALKP